MHGRPDAQPRLGQSKRAERQQHAEGHRGRRGEYCRYLSTLKEKVLNAANDTNTDDDRAQIQKELDQIDDNANVIYNGMYMVDGSKNNIVYETATHLANRNFAETYAYVDPFDGQIYTADVTETTPLVKLPDCTGRSLGIHPGDTITASWVKQGITNIISYPVTEDTSIARLFFGN